jgi:hypothetical protein
MMVDILIFTVTKILDKRSSPCEVEYRYKLEPLWLPADLVKEVQMGCVYVPELRERTGTSSSSRHVKGIQKRKYSQM